MVSGTEEGVGGEEFKLFLVMLPRDVGYRSHYADRYPSGARRMECLCCRLFCDCGFVLG